MPQAHARLKSLTAAGNGDPEPLPSASLSLTDYAGRKRQGHTLLLSEWPSNPDSERLAEGEDFRIVVLSEPPEGTISPAEGVVGPPTTLHLHIQDISHGKRAEEARQAARDELEGKVERRLPRRNPYGLTFRELTVLHLVAAGESDKQIGLKLGISPFTAQNHTSNILANLGAGSPTEAAPRAFREGLFE